MTLEELRVLITAETKELRRSLEDVKKQLRSVDKEVKSRIDSINDAFKGIGKILTSLGLAAFIKHTTAEAMKFEAAVQQIQRLMGSSAGLFQKWANENAATFGMAKSEAISYGAVYANLISTFTSNTAQISQYTQDLLQASAVVASSTGRTMQDVMERIRSGLLGNTEAIEDLGININVAMIESTKAFQQFANGRSWQQLDFRTQQTIRYFAILEQAAQKYGLEIAQNTVSRQAVFIAQLKDAQLALGQAFLPIYNSVLPALTNMAQALAEAMQYLTAFSQALFGYNPAQQTKAAQGYASAVNAVGDAFQEAGKKAKGSLTGFDEINQLADKTGSGAVGTGILPLDTGINGNVSSITAPFEEVSNKAKEMAERVKTAFGDMARFIQEHKEIILAALAGLAAGFATFLIITKWASIISAFETLFLVGLYAIDGLKAAWAALTGPIGLVVLAVAALVAAFVYFYQTNETFRGFVDGILKSIGDMAIWLWNNVLVPLGEWIATVFVAAWDSVKAAAMWLWQNVLVPLGNFLLWFWNNVISPIAGVLIDFLGVAFRSVADVAKSFWQNVLVPLGSFFAAIFGPTIEAISAVLKFLWNNVMVPIATFISGVFKPVFEALKDVIVFLWQNVLKPVTEFLSGYFSSVFDNVFKTIGEIINGLKKTFIGLMEFITGVFTGDWKKAWEGIKDIFGGIWDTIKAILKGVINSIINMINTLIGFWNKLEFSVPKVELPGGITFGGFSVGVPKIPEIPKLARGGIIDSPTLALIGEAGKEAVVPLENTGFVNAIASAVGTAVLSAFQVASGGQNSGAGGDIVIQIDGTTFARIINPFLTREQQRIGTSAIIQPI